MYCRPVCEFNSISDRFNFGKYNGFSLADVLDINPSYVDWCVKHCTGVSILIKDEAFEEIEKAYPLFLMDNLFKYRKLENTLCYQYYIEECDEENIDDLHW